MRKQETESMRASRAERAFLKLHPELRRRCERVRRTLAESGRSDAKARYQLGQLVCLARQDPDRYGQRAVQQLGAALGYDKTTLYHFAEVTERWSAQEFRAVLSEMGVTGLPINFSHLVLIARLPTKRFRNKCVRAVLDEGLSVRELKRSIDRIEIEKAPESRIRRHEPAAVLRDLRSAPLAWLERVKRWEEEVLPALKHSPLPAEDLPVYREALSQHKELVERLSQLTARLGAWLADQAHKPEEQNKSYRGAIRAA